MENQVRAYFDICLFCHEGFLKSTKGNQKVPDVLKAAIGYSFERVRIGEIESVASPMHVLEAKRKETYGVLVDVLESKEWIQVQLSINVAKRARDLSEKIQRLNGGAAFSAPDATHLALAEFAECTTFVTTDGLPELDFFAEPNIGVGILGCADYIKELLGIDVIKPWQRPSPDQYGLPGLVDLPLIEVEE